MLVSVGSGVTAVVLRRAVTGQDANGNDAHGSVPTSYDGCAFWPGAGTGSRAGTETAEFRSLVTDRAQVLLPTGAVITAADRVTVGGSTWLVDGDPVAYSSQLTGAAGGVLVSLTKASG